MIDLKVIKMKLKAILAYVISTSYRLNVSECIVIANFICYLLFMLSFKLNLSVYILATWLVLLQVLSPFVHAHVDTGDHASSIEGLHLHSVDINVLDQLFNHGGHNLVENDSAFDMHIVIVEKGLSQKLDLPNFAMALIAAFIFYVLQTASPKLRPEKQFKRKSKYLRGYLNPRAPPYC